MATSGATSDVKNIFSKYSDTEMKLYQELYTAKDNENTVEETRVKEEIKKGNIPNYVERYKQFVRDFNEYSSHINQLDQQIAYHQEQSDYHGQQLDICMDQAKTLIHQHTDEYVNAMQDAISKQQPTPGKHTNNKQRKKGCILS